MKFNLFVKYPSFKYTLPVLVLVIVVGSGFWLGFGNNQIIKTAVNGSQDVVGFSVLENSVQEKLTDSSAIQSAPKSLDQTDREQNRNESSKNNAGKDSKSGQPVQNAKQIDSVKSNLPIPQNTANGVISLGFPKTSLVAKSNSLFVKKVFAQNTIIPTLLYVKGSFVDKTRAIYAYDIIMGQEKKIIDTEYEDIRPVFSPDYTQIAFTSLKHEEDTRYSSIESFYDVLTKQISYPNNPPAHLSGTPKYSPDGKYVYYGQYVYNLTEKTFTLISNPKIQEGYYAGGVNKTDIFSTDSKYLYLSHFISKLGESSSLRGVVYQYDIANNSFNLISESTDYKMLTNPALINNNEIAYINIYQGNDGKVVKLNIAQKKFTEVLSSYINYSNLWFSQGDKFIFMGLLNNTDEHPSLYLVNNGKATQLKELTGMASGGFIIGWYGDETKFLYINSPSGSNNKGIITLYDLNTNQEYPIVDGISYYDL